MARPDLFILRVNADDRRMLAMLAERLQRNQSDCVRLLIREAARDLEAQNPTVRVAAQKVVANVRTSRVNRKLGRSRKRCKLILQYCRFVLRCIQKLSDFAVKAVPVLVELARYISQSAK